MSCNTRDSPWTEVVLLLDEGRLFFHFNNCVTFAMQNPPGISFYITIPSLCFHHLTSMNFFLFCTFSHLLHWWECHWPLTTMHWHPVDLSWKQHIVLLISMRTRSGFKHVMEGKALSHCHYMRDSFLYLQLLRKCSNNILNSGWSIMLKAQCTAYASNAFVSLSSFSSSNTRSLLDSALDIKVKIYLWTLSCISKAEILEYD